ncbi:MAG: M15 family metallopeptidase [Myxococcota bacterium]
MTAWILAGWLLASGPEPGLDHRLAALPGLVDASGYVPDLRVQLMYGTSQNFIGRAVYQGLTRCFLVRDAAQMLGRARSWLKMRQPGWTFVAYDCVRPRSVQRAMWATVRGTPAQSYVASPAGTASLHNYGCAIDVGLVNERGAPADMGTSFDHFGRKAEPRHEAQLRRNGLLSPEALANRLLLREVMTRAGFIPISNEWWHFNCATPDEVRARYPIVE